MGQTNSTKRHAEKTWINCCYKDKLAVYQWLIFWLVNTLLLISLHWKCIILLINFSQVFWRLGFCVYGFCWLEVGENTYFIIIKPSDDSSLRRLAKNDKNKTFNSLSDEFLGEQSSIKILNITLAQYEIQNILTSANVAISTVTNPTFTSVWANSIITVWIDMTCIASVHTFVYILMKQWDKIWSTLNNHLYKIIFSEHQLLFHAYDLY